MKYAIIGSLATAIYEDKECPSCGFTHPIEVNVMFSRGERAASKMKELGIKVIDFK